ncbi:efflux RND transporter periplasmic adaptor subunit [Pseudorhodoferax sp.]|uniref:efflux RND transporter periplasmic adaptor subunit n=1 Tax=Pseudorhodoferax sp. TaxID=1993553 RepID=UPI002DD64CC8|nr:efflux RND transporter periplasmic adaptor subunit [Pseudorhodoferax sp.]
MQPPPKHRRRGLSPPLSLLGLVLALLAPASQAQAQLQALACLIQPSQVAEVGSAVIGVVQTLEVDRGARVRKGQVLATLRSDVERASAEAAESRAKSLGELRGAVAALDLAELRRDRARQLKDENFVSTQALEQAEAEFRVARERVSQVREALRTATREVNASEAQIAQRTLRAPFDGVVVERYANLGERFEDKALFRIAAISTLRVELVAPMPLFGRLKVGQKVQVTPELPGAAVRTASIAQIDQVLDPASNTFRLRLDLPNADGSLPAGLRCQADLGLAGPTQAPAAAPMNGAAAR